MKSTVIKSLNLVINLGYKLVPKHILYSQNFSRAEIFDDQQIFK